MDIAAEQRRRSFCVWLRTGRRPKLDDQPEVKFNPWHDPRDGRFTFSGTGRYYSPDGATAQANGSAPRIIKFGYEEDTRLPPISTREEVEAWRAGELAKYGRDPDRRRSIEDQYQRYLVKLADRPSSQLNAAPKAARSDDQQGADERQPRSSHQGARPDGASPGPARSSAPQARQRRESRSWTGGGFTGGGGGAGGGGGTTGSWGDPPAPTARQAQSDRSWGGGGFTGGGGGSFGGAGASGSWGEPAARRRAPPASTQSARPSSGGHLSEQWHTIVRNGYTYELDTRGRTRRVSGTLSTNETAERSRANQKRAGGDSRRSSDDGGHYIAKRFNGPTDAFNHFAQDSNFNRGRYRALEDQWAKAKRAGSEVKVAIVPHYRGGSKRPFEIDVSFTINGQRRSIKLPNERTEKSNEK